MSKTMKADLAECRRVFALIHAWAQVGATASEEERDYLIETIIEASRRMLDALEAPAKAELGKKPKRKKVTRRGGDTE